ncbi:MAG: hypothetical protein ACYCQI_16580 [Gammaproteobacteria bacterium]
MKKKILSLAILASLGFTAPAFAESCFDDAMQMRDQILQYGSITTSDYFQLNNVSSVTVTGETSCQAKGYHFGRFICKISWTLSDWGNTVVCG